jgi:hypothetical protein
MRDLRVGDDVWTAGPRGVLQLSRVYAFLDRQPDTTGECTELTTWSGKTLRLSATHLVHARRAEHSTVRPVQAREVQVGDALLVADGIADNAVREEQVVRIQKATTTGWYAPATHTGTLLVDGVLASCYAEVLSHSAAHAALAPLRLASTFTPAKGCARSHDGVHPYARVLRHATQSLGLAV